MNFSNFKLISMVSVTSVILCCVIENGAAVQENEDILEDTILLPRAKHTRHVRRVLNKLSPSVSPPIMDMDLSTATAAQKPRNESESSEEVNFSEVDTSEAPPAPVPTTEHSGKVDNHSSNSLELGLNSSSSQLHNVVDSSEFPSQSKVQRAAVNVKETVVINEDTDRVKLDENETQGSSNLWIYSNAICILLVVGVSIFLIYYPKSDQRRGCKNSSPSSSESSTSSSSASSAA